MEGAAPLAGVQPRFEPALMRRKPAGPFLRRLPGRDRDPDPGLIALLLDVLIVGLPWLD
jgi:hypothetical protein